jgi:hypothetical protein
MISFTAYQTRFGQLTKNSTAANLALGSNLVADSLRYLTGQFYFNERSYTAVTVAGQQFYPLPPQVKRLIDLTVTIGSIVWVPKHAPNREYWDSLNVIPFLQDYPSWYFVYNGNQVGIWPTPATTGNLITMNYQIRLRDLSQADYTTGTVTTPYTTTFTGSVSKGATSATLSGSWALPSGTYLINFSDNEYYIGTFTNGSTAVTWTTALTANVTSAIKIQSATGGEIIIGSGTTFIADMANRWIQITAPTGDNQWYQIGNYYSATAISLLNPYTGTAVSGGSFTIGEMPILSEDYQDLALYRALWIYFTSIVPDRSRSQLYKDLYDVGFEKLNNEYGQKVTSPVLVDQDAPVYNPNLFVRSVSQTN